MSVPEGEDSSREEQLDALLEDYLQRVDAGEKVDRAAYFQQHPEFADELSELLDTAELVDRLAGPPLDSRDASDEETQVSSGKAEPQSPS
ncbi:MAG: hypothetical protein N2C14_03030, partial [Planctomycetales bacterium]